MTDRPYWSRVSEHRGQFFRVLHTTSRSQCAVMTVPPGQEAGPAEIHEDADQVFYIVDGEAEFKVWDGQATPTARTAGPGGIVVVPAGKKHWVRSIGSGPLFFFTVYAPAEY